MDGDLWRLWFLIVGIGIAVLFILQCFGIPID